MKVLIALPVLLLFAAPKVMANGEPAPFGIDENFIKAAVVLQRCVTSESMRCEADGCAKNDMNCICSNLPALVAQCLPDSVYESSANCTVSQFKDARSMYQQAFADMCKSKGYSSVSSASLSYGTGFLSALLMAPLLNLF